MAENKSPLIKIAPLLVMLVIAVILLFWLKGAYNGMVEREENVNRAWSQVENQYQRRADLIPNMVNTVKGYAAHERTTLQAVIDARAKAAGLNVNASGLDAAALQRFQEAQGQLSGALSRLMAVMESYPDLKANQNFRDLQVQLEGTENRIAVERMRFNETAQDYNTSLRSFPANLLASTFGFAPKAYFRADSGAERAPAVDFSGSNR